MKITKPAFAAFMSALTDTDQLSTSERERAARDKRRDEKSATRDARYRGWILAEAAYHRAYAKHWETVAARHLARRGKVDAEIAYSDACHLLIDAVEDFMAVPFQNDGDRKERAVLIRKWGKALGASMVHPAWHAARIGWLAKIGEAA
jgi:hypothetical protein